MFEVQCPSCHAGYKVDERRIPPGGLKMRCPKCGESFPVSGVTEEPPVLGGVLGLKATAPAAPRPRPAAKQTMIGVAPHHSAPPPAPSVPAPSELELASIEEAPAPDQDELELDFLSHSIDRAPGPTHLEGRSQEVPTVREPLTTAPPEPRTSGPPLLDLVDLPALDPNGPGLPSVAKPSSGPPFAGGIGEEFDLPQVGAGLPELPDLPAVGTRKGGAVDLPSLPIADLPTLSADLPTRNAAGGALPIVAAAGLPHLRGGLPARAAADAEFLSEDVLESEKPPAFGLSLSEAPPAASRARAESPGSFSSGAASVDRGGVGIDHGNVDLGGVDDDSSEFDAFPTASDPPEGGGSGYGDVALDDSPGVPGVGLGAEVDRAPVPHGPTAAASAQVVLPTAVEVVRVKTPKSGLSRGTRIGVVSALAVTVAGGALGAFVPSIGPYGAYALVDLVRADQYRADLARDIEAASRSIDADGIEGAQTAFQILDRGRAAAPRFDDRTAYAAFLGLLAKVRFGADDLGAQGTVLVEGLSAAPPSEVKYLELARLARAVATGSPGAALTPGIAERGLEESWLVGEAALLSGNGEAALVAFDRLVAQRPESPRALFGQVRSHRLLGHLEQVKTGAEKVLAKNPNHVGARLSLAELDILGRKKDDEVAAVLEPIGKGGPKVSRHEQTTALILLGDLHLSRGRINEADQAFAGALGLESGNADAQRGLADALFEAGRYSEAQTRYEAALKSAPGSLAAALGLLRSRIQLEELETAKSLLVELQKSHPDSTALQYWSGRVSEQSGDRSLATAAYEKAIKLDQSGPELVAAYVGLTRLSSQEGKTEAADLTIQEAEKRFPDDPLVYEALAELASSRGGFEAAIADYDRALQLDPGNLGLHFAKAVTLRKARRFEEASRVFDSVEQKSKNYPGLALERGNLLEASGKSAEALLAYEQALAEAPDSLDMMLRVGCARAQAGQGGKALDVLHKVERERTSSAEVAFCIGLSHLQRAGGLADARRYLTRAVTLDASRAVYHLYVGWVSIDLGEYSQAGVSLDKALELDQTLADAYWKRGELRVKQGAVDDAVKDLKRALELSPSRYEAHAQLGLAYLQNGKEPLALEEFGKAVALPGVHPYFNYRYGELLLANRRTTDAEKELTKATIAGEKLEPQPPWLWEAHRLLAMALGRQKAALSHWQAFVDHAPKSSPYLGEAAREISAILSALGR